MFLKNQHYETYNRPQIQKPRVGGVLRHKQDIYIIPHTYNEGVRPDRARG